MASSSSSAAATARTMPRAVSTAERTISDLSTRLLSEIDSDLSSSSAPPLVSRLQSFVWRSDAIWAVPSSAVTGAAADVHADGTDIVALPFPLPSQSELASLLEDSEDVARMQAGITALSRDILPLLAQIDAAFIQIDRAQKRAAAARSGATGTSIQVPPSIFHIGLAYRSIKLELSECMSRFARVRTEFISSLRTRDQRTTARAALTALFARAEDWFGRLDALARFCQTPTSADAAAAAAAVLPPGVPAPALGYPGLAEPRFADLLAPDARAEDPVLGVRVTQWVEGGRFMVKIENVGDNRLHLTDALFSMPEKKAGPPASNTAGAGEGKGSGRYGRRGRSAAGADDGTSHASRRSHAPDRARASSSSTDGATLDPEDPASVRKWVDMLRIDRVLTPLQQRRHNLRSRLAEATARAAAGYGYALGTGPAEVEQQRAADAALIAAGDADLDCPAFICFAFAPAEAEATEEDHDQQQAKKKEQQEQEQEQRSVRSRATRRNTASAVTAKADAKGARRGRSRRSNSAHSGASDGDSGDDAGSDGGNDNENENGNGNNGQARRTRAAAAAANKGTTAKAAAAATKGAGTGAAAGAASVAPWATVAELDADTDSDRTDDDAGDDEEDAEAAAAATAADEIAMMSSSFKIHII